MEKTDIQVNDYLLVKGRDRWEFDKTNEQWLVDGVIFECNFENDDLNKSEMAKFLGTKIQVKELIDIAEEIDDLQFIKCTEGWVWEIAAIERIIDMENDPEHFV